jgi:hypothetical protein
MNIKSISFTDLIPLSTILEKYAKSPSNIKGYFIAGIRKKILFHAVNQSEKYVHMIRWGEIEIDYPPYHARIHEKEEKICVVKGRMLPLAKIHQFDKLFKGVLNEIDLFEDIGDYHELIEYQRDLRLFHEYAGSSALTPPIEFRDIEYKHIFIEAKNIEAIEELLKTQSSPKANKQTQREIVFLEWLDGKDELVVRNMKTADVWEELRKLDPHLFSPEPKTFFRVQKIMAFKPGPKSNKQS